MPERGPKVKPPMDKPKARTMGGVMPREARRQLMKEYVAKNIEKAGRYHSEPTDTGQKPDRQAVQQVEDFAKDGAEKAGRTAENLANKGINRLKQNQQQKKMRKDFVVKKAEKAINMRSVERGASSVASGKKAPKTETATPKDKPGAARLKAAPPTAKTSKAALAGRKAKNAGKSQLKKQAAKAAQATKKGAAKAAQRMAQMLKNTAKAVVKLLSTIASSAGPFVLILAAYAGIAMMIASPFGLFFSKEDTGAGVAPISAVIRETAEDFNQQLLAIQNGNEWDELRIHYDGKRGNNWKDVLAVFAVKTVMFDENAADVVTIDADKAGRIRAVFWDMTELSHRMETVEHYDAETDTTTYTYILHITITQRSATTQAERYAFTQDQKDILAEMLGGAYDEFFCDLIGSAGEIGGGTPVIGIGSYIWPSDSSSRVTSYFGPRTHPVTGEEDDHYGIDIGAGRGSNVLAADAGRVVTAEWHWSYGNYIIIDHGDGRRTLYAHMSLLIAGSGQAVAQGEVIGLVGSTGVVDGAHLHFETYANGGRVDPLSYFSGYC